MKIIYAKKSFDHDKVKYGSIFLAGPTPRSSEVISWRPAAIELFKKQNYAGMLLVPEETDGNWRGSYEDQVEWEEDGLRSACCIMFWIPRKIPEMAALTTNDEWGFWKKSGKVVFGAPPDAERVSYQRYYANKYSVPNFSSLEDTVQGAIKMDLMWRLK
jgi:hypothetical protein